MAARCLLLLSVLLVAAGKSTQGGGLVPAAIVFGDSLVDVGNNGYIHTAVKADLPPYGRDLEAGHVATGRFSNGKLLSDLISEKLGFITSPPAYLSPHASGENLLVGANFESAGSGYYGPTSLMYHVIPLSQQLENFREYQSKLLAVVGGNIEQAQSIISGSLYIISFGSNDFLFNYYINSLLFETQTAGQFFDLLVSISTNTVTKLYSMGARRIGVFSMPPLGCAPLAITVFGHGEKECVPRLNDDARRYNVKLNAAVGSLLERYRDLKIAVLDIYTPLYVLSTSPESQRRVPFGTVCSIIAGFTEARSGCCATGTVEFTVFLCNPKSIGTCPNATAYVFWDSLHPSEAANKVIVDSLADGINQLVV